jgi:hypothetical protein
MGAFRDLCRQMSNMKINLLIVMLTILAMSLICHDLAAADKPRDFQTVDNLIANVKQADPKDLLYDTNGTIVGAKLPFACCTDHNLGLLSEIKTLRYLHIFVFSNFNKATKIVMFSEYGQSEEVWKTSFVR